MIDSKWTRKDELIDILMDLKHDLGKYIFLHLSHLTTDSPSDLIEDALHVALFKTRKISGQYQTAEQIWIRYKKEIEALDYSFPSYERLTKCVDAALSMESFLESSPPAHPIHVGQIQKIARQISETIVEIIEEEKKDTNDDK